MSDAPPNNRLSATPPPRAAHRASKRQGLALRYGIACTYFGNLVYVSAQAGLLVVMARHGNATLLGQYIYCLAVISPVFMLTSLRLQSLQATDVRNEFQFGHYLAVALLGNSLAIALTGAAASLFATTPFLQTLMILIAFQKYLEAMTDTCYGWLQQNERLDLVAVSRTFQGVMQFTAFSAGILLTNNLLWAIGAAALCRGTIGLGLDIVLMLRCHRGLRLGQGPAESVVRFIVRHRPLFERRAMWSLTRLSAPLAVTVLLTSLINNCPKYFLAHFEDAAVLGIFGVFAYLLTAGATLTRAVNQASCTRLAQLHADARYARFRQVLSAILVLYFGVSCVFLLAAWWRGPQLLAIVFGAEFAPYSGVLMVILISGAFNYSAGLVDTGLIAVRRTALLPRLVAVSGILMLLLCFALIPTYGLYGAAAALGLAKIPMVVCGLVVLLRNGSRGDRGESISSPRLVKSVERRPHRRVLRMDASFDHNSPHTHSPANAPGASNTPACEAKQ